MWHTAIQCEKKYIKCDVIMFYFIHDTYCNRCNKIKIVFIVLMCLYISFSARFTVLIFFQTSSLWSTDTIMCLQMMQALLMNHTSTDDYQLYFDTCIQLKPPSHVGHTIYIYTMPVIVVVGLCGNALSLRVFLCPTMRKLSATAYLAALSLSDMIVLLTFGALKWLDITMDHLTGSSSIQVLAYPGVCHMYEYVVHVARFISVWCLVVFTIG